MKKLGSIILILCLGATVFAQDITGTWSGQLAIRDQKLALIFHITKQGNTYTSTLDSPDQNSMGIPTSTTNFVANTLTITATQLGLKYTGVYNADSAKIAGTFTQGTAVLPLVLSRKHIVKTGMLEPSKRRAQDPVAFPYSCEEVTITNSKAGCTLAGTLTMPRDRKAKKIAVLIAGSGAHDRNEDMSFLNHRPFLVLSDWLTRQGFGVLRYDKRGVGKSTGNLALATTADFADDAEAAVYYIAARKDLKGIPIGLIGHSEGGLIAPIIAARNNTIAFVVLLAGPGIPIARLMLKQDDELNKLAGLTPQISSTSHQINREVYNFLNTHQQANTEQAKVGLIGLVDSSITLFSKSDQEKKALKQSFVGGLQALLSPWFRYFIAMDPGLSLGKVRSPLLALNGSLDCQVSAAENLQAIKAHLAASGNKNATVLTLEGMNHLFQKASTGSIQEYGQIEETVNPLALKTVSDWIKRL